MTWAPKKIQYLLGQWHIQYNMTESWQELIIYVMSVNLGNY
jgi:hypothetical protein